MKQKCNYKCEECTYPDCINNDITEVEIMEAEMRNISYGRVLHGKPNKTIKGKRK